MKLALFCFFVAILGRTAVADRFSLFEKFKPRATASSRYDAEATSTQSFGPSGQPEPSFVDTLSRARTGGSVETTDGRIEGRGYAKAASYAEAISEMQAVLREAAVDASDKTEVEAYVYAYASAAAEAFAAAYVTVDASIVSTGSGSKGCASAEAESQAIAGAFAAVFVQAVTYVNTKDGPKYKAEIQEEDIVTLVALAFSEAAVEVCAEGYATANAYQEALSYGISTAFIDAFVDAASWAYKGGVKGDSEVYSDSIHETDSDQFAGNEGEVEVEATENGSSDGSSEGDNGAAGYVVELCRKLPEYKRCCTDDVNKKKKPQEKLCVEKDGVDDAFETENGYCLCSL